TSRGRSREPRRPPLVGVVRMPWTAPHLRSEVPERADQRADRGAAWGAAGEVKEPAAGAQATFTPTMAPMAAPAIIAAAAPQPIGRASRIGKEGCCVPDSLGRNPARHKPDTRGPPRPAA